LGFGPKPPIPNPQSPIPNPQSPTKNIYLISQFIKIYIKNNHLINNWPIDLPKYKNNKIKNGLQ